MFQDVYVVLAQGLHLIELLLHGLGVAFQTADKWTQRGIKSVRRTALATRNKRLLRICASTEIGYYLLPNVLRQAEKFACVDKREVPLAERILNLTRRIEDPEVAFQGPP